MASIAVLGPGGVGGFVAAALARARVDVVLVAREPAATALTLTGVSVQSAVLGNFVAHPGVVAQLTEPVDVLLVATKATGLEAALDRIHAEPRLVVPLLNGVEHLQVLRERFGSDRVVAAVIRVESDRPSAGEIVQTSPACRIDIAGARPEVAALAQMLEHAGLAVRTGDCEPNVMWSKLDAPVPAGADHKRVRSAAGVRALRSAVALGAGQCRGRDGSSRRRRGCGA